MQKIRAFPSRVEYYHLDWLSEALDIGMGDSGIDLGDHELAVEMKCKDQFWTGYHHAVHEYQVREYPQENQGKKMFFGFVGYRLSKRPKEIPKNADLEAYITERKAWFFPWEWIKQIKVSYPKTGPFRYVSKKTILASGPFTEFKKGGGSLYLSKGCEALEQRLL